MAKHHFRFALVLSILISLGLVSFVSCILAELKKTKKNEIKLDGNLCYLPPSHSFEFGIAALTCLLIAQIIGNFVTCANFCTRDMDIEKEKMNKTNTISAKAKTKTPTITTTLLLISWMCFGIAVILLSAATSMNRQQEYGKGWLDGECYVVRQGVYSASAIIILLSIGSILGSAILTITKGKIEAGAEDTTRSTTRTKS